MSELLPEASYLTAAPAASGHGLIDAARSASRHRLLLRFIAANMAGVALVGAAWARGYVDMMLAADATGLTVTICGVFIAGLILAGHRAWRLSLELSALDAGWAPPESWTASYLAEVRGGDSGARANTAHTHWLRLTAFLAPVRHVANSLVLLGLIGTVIGFIIALSGIEPDSVADVHAISPMVSTLLQGMAVALYTTLVGAGLNLWLSANHHILAGGAAELAVRLSEMAEADAKSV